MVRNTILKTQNSTTADLRWCMELKIDDINCLIAISYSNTCVGDMNTWKQIATQSSQNSTHMAQYCSSPQAGLCYWHSRSL